MKEWIKDQSSDKIRIDSRPYLPFENASGDEAQAARDSEKSLSRWSCFIKIISFIIIVN